jgi:hypothetical protein
VGGSTRINPSGIGAQFALALGIVALGLATTLSIDLLVGFPASLTQLDFGYGDKVARVMAGEGLGDATRLPAIPYFLGAFGAILDHSLAAALAKNVFFLVPLAWVLARVWLEGPRDLVVAGGIAFLMSFPQLVRHTLALVPEEGWVIPLVAFAFHAFLTAGRTTPVAGLAPAVLAISALVLIKSTMLLAAPVLVAMLAIKSRQRALAALAIGLLTATILGLSTLHLANAGRFTPTSSLSGYDLWKGNNPAALEHFPARSLDAISHLAPPWTEELDEWSWNRRCVEEALDFWRKHPADAIELTRRKFNQVFFRVSGEASPSDYTGRDLLKPVGIVWMVGFRIALWLAIAIAITTLIRPRRDPDSSRDAMIDAAGFLALVAALAAPFLLAWGTERRLMPMVIPVFLYLWSVWRRHRGTADQSKVDRA